MLFLAPSMVPPPPIPLRDSEQACLVLRPPLLRLPLAQVSASPLDEVFRLAWQARLPVLEVPRRLRVVLVSHQVVSLEAHRVLLGVEDPQEDPVSFLQFKSARDEKRKKQVLTCMMQLALRHPQVLHPRALLVSFWLTFCYICHSKSIC